MRRTLSGILLFVCSATAIAAVCEDKPQARTEPGDEVRQIGSLRYADEGTKDVRGDEIQRIDAENFAFSPTFLRGNPGQRIKLIVENRSTDTEHNFTLADREIVQGIPPDEAIEVDVTFPDSGALLFLCHFHSTRGMNGQLLVGDATQSADPD